MPIRTAARSFYPGNVASPRRTADEILFNPLWLVPLALLLRAPLFGNPVIFSDEQFYLLVGDRLLHGALPYVDIWDRKPIGLFLIYAAIRLLGGTGIVQYQVVASLFAGATAMLIARIGARLAAPRGGLLAGAAYLVWLMIFDGQGGQAPVFYDLPIAGAGLLLLRAVDADARRLRREGAAAMALVGLALQIKYSVVFEGVFFGLWLLWRTRSEGAPALVGNALLWAGIALAPTAAVLLFYEVAGHGAAFVYANFVSVFARRGDDAAILAGRLASILLGAAPLLVAAGWSWVTGALASAGGRLVAMWTLASVGGLLLFGSYYDHYALPVLVPLCAACAPTLEARRIGGLRLRPAAAILALGLAGATVLLHQRIEKRGTARQIEGALAIIEPRLDHCLYLFGSEPILYQLSHACMVTPFAFRSHLSEALEAQAIGRDPVAEMKRLLAQAPSVIVVREPRANTNLATLTVLLQALARDYRPIGTQRIGQSRHFIFARRHATDRALSSPVQGTIGGAGTFLSH